MLLFCCSFSGDICLPLSRSHIPSVTVLLGSRAELSHQELRLRTKQDPFQKHQVLHPWTWFPRALLRRCFVGRRAGSACSSVGRVAEGCAVLLKAVNTSPAASEHSQPSHQQLVQG